MEWKVFFCFLFTIPGVGRWDEAVEVDGTLDGSGVDVIVVPIWILSFNDDE